MSDESTTHFLESIAGIESEPDIAEAYRERPDPSEPWRYACPDCGSVHLRRVISTDRPEGKRYTIIDGGREAARDERKRVHCRSCGRKEYVMDKKHGELTPSQEVVQG